jgi:hypothetical protein
MVGELIVTTGKRDGGGLFVHNQPMFDPQYNISFP